MIKRFHQIKHDATLKGCDKLIFEMVKKYPHAYPSTLSSSSGLGQQTGNTICYYVS